MPRAAYNPFTSKNIIDLLSEIANGNNSFEGLQKKAGGKKGTISSQLHTLTREPWKVIQAEPSSRYERRIKKYLIVPIGVVNLYIEWLNEYEKLTPAHKQYLLENVVFIDTLYNGVSRHLRNNPVREGKKRKWHSLHEIFTAFSYNFIALSYELHGLQKGMNLKQSPDFLAQKKIADIIRFTLTYHSGLEREQKRQRQEVADKLNELSQGKRHWTP